MTALRISLLKHQITSRFHAARAQQTRSSTLQTRSVVVYAAATKSKGKSSAASGKTLFVNVEADGSDSWRLDAVVNLLKQGGVGILPTDTYPAFVCDLENKSAVQTLYELKGISPSKRLSILCRNFSDISTYTLGFPASNIPGQTDYYRLAKKALPGPFTIILHASKQLPKQITNYTSGKSKHRTTVGVRMPDDVILQAVLQQLDRPLLSTTCKMPDGSNDVDLAVLADLYGSRGLGFVVAVEEEVQGVPVEASTVIDLSGSEPELVREGKGDASLFGL